MQQKRTLSGAAETARSRKPEGAQNVARHIADALRAHPRTIAHRCRPEQTLAGNPMNAFSHGAQAFRASRSLLGEGAAAEAAAAEGAEVAGGAGIGTMLAAVGVAGAAGLAYKVWENPAAAEAVPGAVLSIMEAKKYGSQEEPRQAQAYRAAREFGESGQSMIGATSGGRWSALGIEPSEATQTVAGTRELGGSKYISNAAAFKGAQLGTYLGFTPEQSAQVGGQAGRLGVKPEEAIRTIAAGVERGNQQGRQFEVAQASLDYLKQIASRAAVSGETGLTSISNLAAILAKSGISGLQGAQGISAIGGIEAAHAADDIFGVQAAGAGFVQLGEANILRGVNADKRFAARSPRDSLALAEQIRQQGFSGPYGKIYGAAIYSVIFPPPNPRWAAITAWRRSRKLQLSGWRI